MIHLSRLCFYKVREAVGIVLFVKIMWKVRLDVQVQVQVRNTSQVLSRVLDAWATATELQGAKGACCRPASLPRVPGKSELKIGSTEEK